MKIIDFHIHAGDYSLLRDDIQALLNRIPMEPDLDFRVPFANGQSLLAYIQPHGVEKAVILAECGPGTNFSIDSQLVANYCKHHDNLIPFGSINPNHHNPLDEFWKSIDLGIRGFKLYPSDHFFDPRREDMHPIYAYCEELGLPLMFHTGYTAQKDALELNIQPADFEFLGEKYPDLVIVLAHSGKPNWYEECLDLALRYPNVYAETALVPPDEYGVIYGPHENLKKKIVFGSDWPVVGSYTALLKKVKAANLPDDFLAHILHINAERILDEAFKKQEKTLERRVFLRKEIII